MICRQMKPRNYVAKATQSGAGKHVDKRAKKFLRDVKKIIQDNNPSPIDREKLFATMNHVKGRMQWR